MDGTEWTLAGTNAVQWLFLIGFFLEAVGLWWLLCEVDRSTGLLARAWPFRRRVDASVELVGHGVIIGKGSGELDLVPDFVSMTIEERLAWQEAEMADLKGRVRRMSNQIVEVRNDVTSDLSTVIQQAEDRQRSYTKSVRDILRPSWLSFWGTVLLFLGLTINTAAAVASVS